MKTNKIMIGALAGMVFPLMASAQDGAGYEPVVREGIEWGYVDDYFAFDLGGCNFFRLPVSTFCGQVLSAARWW